MSEKPLDPDLTLPKLMPHPLEGLREVIGGILAKKGRDALLRLNETNCKHLSDEDWEFAQKLARKLVEKR